LCKRDLLPELSRFRGRSAGMDEWRMRGQRTFFSPSLSRALSLALSKSPRL
jgi:hypothetical protein